MEKQWKNKNVQTFRPIRAIKGNIPSGWRGSVISSSKAMNGKTLLAVVWENTGQEVSVFVDEIEEC